MDVILDNATMQAKVSYGVRRNTTTIVGYRKLLCKEYHNFRKFLNCCERAVQLFAPSTVRI